MLQLNNFFRSKLFFLCLFLSASSTMAQNSEPSFRNRTPGSEALDPESLPLGVRAVAEKIHFSIKSVHAQQVELLVFSQAMGEEAKISTFLTKGKQDTWTVSIDKKTLVEKGIGDVLYYGYRFWGPNWVYDPQWKPGTIHGFKSDVDQDGNRFNPNKLLFDPYALELSHDPVNEKQRTNQEFATGPDYRLIDTARIATKGIFFGNLNLTNNEGIGRPLKDEIIYETHVRGLTMMGHPAVPIMYRGTYKGATYLIPYLKELGITAIEFLPVQETQNDQNDLNVGTEGDNYWGYMTLNYFAPDRRYAFDKSPGGPTREFQEMAKEFKKNGIKVYIDVVYNHTAEGGLWQNNANVAELYSFRGIDNTTYYTTSEDRRFYYDNTGIGHNFNVGNSIANDLVIDSLKHWKQLGVDGFRFDLAAVLANSQQIGQPNFDKLNPQSILNRAFNELPGRDLNEHTLATGVDLIAEPWAIGMYEQGNFPRGWAEWNGKYRDLIRKKLNKLGYENVTPSELIRFLAGSSHLFQDDGRKPFHSINFLVAHDGFTLRDVFSYNEKNNMQSWPFGPSDGGEDHNISWDQGGDIKQQLKATKNAMTFLMLSAGTPMMTAGDENFRTVKGNNNSYNLDSEMNWLRWEEYRKSSESQDLNAFTKKLIALRKKLGSLRRFDFFKGVDHNHMNSKDIVWLTERGEMKEGDFENSQQNVIGYRLDLTEEGHKEWKTMVVYFNFDSQSKKINLPRETDLAVAQAKDFNSQKWMTYLSSSLSSVSLDSTGSFEMEGRSSVIFIEKL